MYCVLWGCVCQIHLNRSRTEPDGGPQPDVVALTYCFRRVDKVLLERVKQLEKSVTTNTRLFFFFLLPQPNASCLLSCHELFYCLLLSRLHVHFMALGILSTQTHPCD